MPPPPSAPRSPPVPIPLRLLLLLNRILCQTFHRVTLLGTPPTQRDLAHGAIIAPNHTAGLDPLLVQSCLPTPVRWMMAREYLAAPGLSFVFRHCAVIPVNRTGQDLQATRTALRALRDGQLLGIFPEGRIETSHDLLPLAPGIAYLSRQSRKPIYPVWIEGTQRKQTMLGAFACPHEAIVKFGQRIDHDQCHSPAELIPLLESQYRLLKTFSAPASRLTEPRRFPVNL